jgi:hypothetical protein
MALPKAPQSVELAIWLSIAKSSFEVRSGNPSDLMALAHPWLRAGSRDLATPDRPDGARDWR